MLGIEREEGGALEAPRVRIRRKRSMLIVGVRSLGRHFSGDGGSVWGSFGEARVLYILFWGVQQKKNDMERSGG